jgi:hypothetical protein
MLRPAQAGYRRCQQCVSNIGTADLPLTRRGVRRAIEHDAVDYRYAGSNPRHPGPQQSVRRKEGPTGRHPARSRGPTRALSPHLTAPTGEAPLPSCSQKGDCGPRFDWRRPLPSGGVCGGCYSVSYSPAVGVQRCRPKAPVRPWSRQASPASRGDATLMVSAGRPAKTALRSAVVTILRVA